MKNLSRQEVTKKFDEIVAKYGKPRNGNIFCKDQLIAEIAYNLCTYDTVSITYEYGSFNVSACIAVLNKYADDYELIGTVNAKEWYTKEQLKAMHELAFGYQF